ncbi:hypothetical protein HN51_026017 [Arachis hypogaea]
MALDSFQLHLTSQQKEFSRLSPLHICPLSHAYNHDTSSTQECLGKQCVNNSKVFDVTFLVEEKRFYAHRVCLVK